jgi:predicted transcriptional regulator
MVEEQAPVRRRRLGAHGMMFRRRRIFARLREGFTYDEIASEEGLSRARIRQIVSEELQKRAVDSGTDHAKLQLDRLAAALQVAAEAVAAGDVRAIPPYLKVIDRLDRYQTVAVANQAYDDEARKKLMDKLNRVAQNLGVDKVYATVREHLRKAREIREGRLAAGEGERAHEASPAEAQTEADGLAAVVREAVASAEFSYLNQS